jgi:hypothetical protein
VPVLESLRTSGRAGKAVVLAERLPPQVMCGREDVGLDLISVRVGPAEIRQPDRAAVGCPARSSCD